MNKAICIMHRDKSTQYFCDSDSFQINLWIQYNTIKIWASFPAETDKEIQNLKYNQDYFEDKDCRIHITDLKQSCRHLDYQLSHQLRCLCPTQAKFPTPALESNFLQMQTQGGSGKRSGSHCPCCSPGRTGLNFSTQLHCGYC